METTALTWTVMTWNIQGAKRTDLQRIAGIIAAETPDAIALQEVRRPQALELANELSMSVLWVEKHHALRPLFPGRAEGAAILTPHLLSRGGHRTISTRRWKRSFRRRIVQWATIERPDASAYRLYNTHLSPHGFADARLAEAKNICELAITDRAGSPPPIVAGDFNDYNEAQVIAALPGIEHIPVPPTNPAEDPTQPIDHVLLPAEAHDVSVSVPAGGTLWQNVSDHLPVTVRFSLDWVQGGFAS